MQPRYQRSLQAKLQEHAAMYGLSEVTFRSFMLKRGWSRVGSELTAADTVAAVTALLEASGRQDDPDNTHTAKFWCVAGAQYQRSRSGADPKIRQGLGDESRAGLPAVFLLPTWKALLRGRLGAAVLLLSDATRPSNRAIYA